MSEIITDPSVINQLGAQFEQGGEASEQKPVTTLLPPSTDVTLPGGYIGKDGLLVKHAEIRELNGADEEAIFNASSLSKMLNIILERGLVSLGDKQVTQTDLDNLLIGDRDALLLAIRVATFGKDATVPAICKCGSQQLLEINLEEDVDVTELDNPIKDRYFTVETKSGTVKLCLPNGITQKKLMEAKDASKAELVTLVLAGCIVSVNDELSMGRSTALSLGIQERETLITEIDARTPGPRLGGVSKACKACGTSLTVSLSWADLFRL